MRLRKLAVLLLLAGNSIMACRMSAQKPLRMTIDELFRRVEQSNVEVKAAQKDVNISRQLEKTAKAKRLPDIDLEAGVNYLGDATILERDFSKPTRSPMPHLGNTLSLSLYQPLYAGGEISAGIEKTRFQTQIASTDLKIVTDDIKIEVLECYLDLLKNRNLLNVYDENIKLTKELISEMKARSEQGVALTNDVTRYELNLSNLTYDRSTVANAVEHLNYSLLVYLGMDEDVMIEPDLDPNKVSMPDLGLNHWKQEVEMSPKLKKFDLAYSQAKTQEKLVRSQMLPSIGITAGNNLEGPITICIPVMDNNLNSWWFGVKLSMNLSSLYKNNSSLKAAKMETAKLVDNRQAEKEILDRKMDQVYKYYTEACEQVETQKKNVELANENYRIVSRRYSADLSLLTDMLDASTAKLDAEVRLVNARVNVVFYYYQLKYISGNF